jgi:alkylhydroperoxidase/carboxymuconolactone decarboxylase family protein YurZ
MVSAVRPGAIDGGRRPHHHATVQWQEMTEPRPIAAEVVPAGRATDDRPSTHHTGHPAGARQHLRDLREPTKRLRQQIPDVFQGFLDTSQATMTDGTLSARHKELIALARRRWPSTARAASRTTPVVPPTGARPRRRSPRPSA